MSLGDVLAIAVVVGIIGAIIFGRRKARSNLAAAFSSGEAAATARMEADLSNRVNVHVGNRIGSVDDNAGIGVADAIHDDASIAAYYSFLRTGIGQDSDSAHVLGTGNDNDNTDWIKRLGDDSNDDSAVERLDSRSGGGRPGGRVVYRRSAVPGRRNVNGHVADSDTSAELT